MQNYYIFWGVIASSIIGGVTVIALAFSVHYSRKEVSTLENQSIIENRPWLGATTMMSYETNLSWLIFHYKNYGKQPANQVIEHHGFSEKLVTKEEIQDIKTNVEHVSLLLPDQSADFTIRKFDFDVKERIEKGNKPLFVWIVIDYLYGSDKKGQYGVIFQFNKISNLFDVKIEWAA